MRAIIIAACCTIAVTSAIGKPVDIAGYKRYFLAPCSSDVHVNSRSADFKDDWGTGDSIEVQFKRQALDRVLSEVASIDTSIIILRSEENCADSGVGVIKKRFNAEESISLILPKGVDTANSIVFGVKNIDYRVSYSLRKGGNVFVPGANGIGRVVPTSDTFKKRLSVTYDLGVVVPREGAMVHAEQMESTSGWPIFNLVTKGNWTGATSFMASRIKTRIKAFKQYEPPKPE